MRIFKHDDDYNDNDDDDDYDDTWSKSSNGTTKNPNTAIEVQSRKIKRTKRTNLQVKRNPTLNWLFSRLDTHHTGLER